MPDTGAVGESEPARFVTKVVIAAICILAMAVTSSKASVQDEFIRVSAAGWHFETARTHKPFIPFGGVYFDPATYEEKPFPRFLLIEKFDEQRTDRHFAQIAGIGANLVRISTSVKTFSPEYKKTNPAAFKKLDRIIALAKKHNLRVILDPFGGWEGMPDWLPWPPAAYIDGKMMGGLEFMFSEFAKRYKNEPTVFSYFVCDEPTFLWTFHGMPSGFGDYVRSLYGTEDNLKTAWSDFPKRGERWDRIISPKDVPDAGSRRLYDYQRFREDIVTGFVERMAAAFKASDPNHMVTVATIQWNAPLRFFDQVTTETCKPSGYSPFNPRKIGKYLDYMDTHAYNWVDGNVAEFVQAMGRYCYYPGKPLMLGEYEFDRKVIDYNRGAFSGFVAWAFYPVPDQPFKFLFDKDGNLTGNGKAFAETAVKVAKGQIVFNRIPDAAVFDADGVSFLSDPRSAVDTYQSYVEGCRGAHPLGLRMTGPSVGR